MNKIAVTHQSFVQYVFMLKTLSLKHVFTPIKMIFYKGTQITNYYYFMPETCLNVLTHFLHTLLCFETCFIFKNSY